MIFTDAMIFAGKQGFIHGSFRVGDGRFQQVSSSPEGAALPAGRQQEHRDLGGAYVIPGLIDIHIHGAAGADFSDGDPEGLARMASFLAKNGITGFAPASMTLPRESLERAFRNAAQFSENRPAGCARFIVPGTNVCPKVRGRRTS